MYDDGAPPASRPYGNSWKETRWRANLGAEKIRGMASIAFRGQCAMKGTWNPELSNCALKFLAIGAIPAHNRIKALEPLFKIVRRLQITDPHQIDTRGAERDDPIRELDQWNNGGRDPHLGIAGSKVLQGGKTKDAVSDRPGPDQKPPHSGRVTQCVRVGARPLWQGESTSGYYRPDTVACRSCWPDREGLQREL